MLLLKRIFWTLLAFAAVVWLINTNAFLTPDPTVQPRLIAHRGVHQIYAGPDRTAQTCGANPVLAADHNFIANTIPSMQAAFAAGADIVEVDVHLTADDHFAVFHDWTLDCQTDGQGVTHKQMMDDLRQLDLGYGYTVDGQTFPLRGHAVGAMPTLAEILAADLDGRFLINFKSNRAREGTTLASRFADNPAIWGVYGGDNPTEAVMDASEFKGFGKDALIACLVRYAAIGWTGYVPSACQDRVIAIPMDYGPYLWGWPHKFTNRMKAAGTEVILWGPYDGSGFSSGVDDAETLTRVPDHFDGYIWTNRIETIGPLLER